MLGSWLVVPVGNSVGQRRIHERRRDVGLCWPEPVGDSIGRSALQTASRTRSVGVADANVIGMPETAWVYWRQGVSLLAALVKRRREQRRELGWLEPRTGTASGCWRWCWGVRLLAAMVKRRCKWRWDLVRSALWTRRGMLKCRRQRGAIGVRTWVDRRQGVGWYLGRSALWTQTALGCRRQCGSISAGTWVD